MYVAVRVTPGGKRERVTKVDDHTYEMVVREAAKRNMANRRVQAILAGEFETAARNVRLISGHRSPKKIFSIEL